MMRAMPTMMEMRRGAGQPEASVAIAETYANMLELYVIHHQTSIGVEGFAGDVSNSERVHNVKSTNTKPRYIQRESVVLESPSYQDPCPSF